MQLLNDEQAQLLRAVKADLAEVRLGLAELETPREALATGATSPRSVEAVRASG